MAFIWTNRLAVGVPLIDEQHRELISNINSLLEAMKQGKGKQEIGRLLKFVESYVDVHFGAEEKLMIGHKYPEYTAHKAKHSEFIRDFARLREEIRSSPASGVPMIETQRRVCDWWTTHICGTDKLLGDFLNTTG